MQNHREIQKPDSESNSPFDLNQHLRAGNSPHDSALQSLHHRLKADLAAYAVLPSVSIVGQEKHAGG